jgi:hypothetical protein
VLEAEALDGDLQPRRAGVVERRHEALLELVHVELGRVDDEVGRIAGPLQQVAFQLDRLDEAVRLRRQWVLATGRVVPPDEVGVLGVEEQHGHPVTGGSQRRDGVQHGAVVATRHEGEPLDAAPWRRGELDDRADQRGGEVVDHVPAEVLEHISRRGTSGSGHPGDEDDLGHRWSG